MSCRAQYTACENTVPLNALAIVVPHLHRWPLQMYVALFPCNECAKMIIQSGIREVIYLSDKYHDANPFIASRRLLDLAGVQHRQYVPTRDTVVLKLRE